MCRRRGVCSITKRFAPAMAAMARLNRIWLCSTISFASKVKLYTFLVTAILLYGCETWSLLADFETKKKRKKEKRKKGPRFSNPSACGNFSVSPIWSTRPMTSSGTRSASLWVHRNLFWKLLRVGNLHGSGTSHATTADNCQQSET